MLLELPSSMSIPEIERSSLITESLSARTGVARRDVGRVLLTRMRLGATGGEPGGLRGAIERRGTGEGENVAIEEDASVEA